MCKAFGVTAADLRYASHSKAIALPRAVALYFGSRDHNTFVAAECKVTDLFTRREALDLSTSRLGRTFGELIDELEQRKMTLAS